jgi:hypothetical protein
MSQAKLPKKVETNRVGIIVEGKNRPDAAISPPMLLSIAQERRMYASNANNDTSVFEAAHKLVKKSPGKTDIRGNRTDAAGLHHGGGGEGQHGGYVDGEAN